MLNTTAWNRLRYSLYAPVYDLVAARAFRRARRLALEAVHWRQGQRVLLVGAGTGLDLPCLPRDIEVHAIDISPVMIARLEARADRHGLDVIAATMDAARLAYPDAHFDVVVMHLIVAVMPDPKAGLSEAHRVLAEDGQLCVMDKFQSDARPAGLGRRLVNMVTSFLATDITRQARPLLEGAGFIVEHDTPVMMGSLFRALLARKA
ncbi:class I SAM-dependent methyltransferase [Chromohalobacter sp. TMW 2.2308]|uniref:Class I SAM-dependent methyltransferase n=2 Tax=Chromohalobacter TaxID=42054 RepID=A0A9X3B328_9GAMM|nr:MULTISPECIES: class I SAM-dependent methyltransferase [Chromohalobacter]MCK2042607.1 class I SAM-dependent methyltransferase [Chromohalobacter moromii]MCK2045493.1 class I SAM-dependent methyltransferase [Chromohalobacter moromii]MCT8504840.1 class I SAM-dependent methyltransferase [Chromohalobacter moromii]MCT8514874.1 class I SAM-dependent methyltransferase [Chromohalobacter sp. TMW 2.2271]SOC53278.1 phosphatidylethanolamine N-methyltransferase /phosphatidyl-N-methylethanolamine N-methylt